MKLTWKRDKKLIKTIIFACLFVPVLLYGHYQMHCEFGWGWKWTTSIMERIEFAWGYIVYLLTIALAYFWSIRKD